MFTDYMPLLRQGYGLHHTGAVMTGSARFACIVLTDVADLAFALRGEQGRSVGGQCRPTCAAVIPGRSLLAARAAGMACVVRARRGVGMHYH